MKPKQCENKLKLKGIVQRTHKITVQLQCILQRGILMLSNAMRQSNQSNNSDTKTLNLTDITIKKCSEMEGTNHPKVFNLCVLPVMCIALINIYKTVQII